MSSKLANLRMPMCTARSSIRGGLLCGLVGATLLTGNVTSARADADPASDVLFAQNAFYPYKHPVGESLEAALNKTLSTVGRVWLPLKVAIIGSPEDLGAVPEFFGHPQRYADFLDREITLNSAQPLLVVMAAGYGHAAISPASVLARLHVDGTHSSYGLTRSAILAVVALARAAGHPIPLPFIPAPAATHSSFPVAALFALPVLLLALAGLIVGRKTKRRRRHVPPPAGPV